MDAKIDSQINIWQFGVSMLCFEFTMYQFLSTDSVIINTGIAFHFDLNIWYSGSLQPIIPDKRLSVPRSPQITYWGVKDGHVQNIQIVA